MHALALAERGYEVLGTDLSAGMIERARANARAAGLKARFAVAGLGELCQRTGGAWDAALCLGNSLPHLLTPADLCLALNDLAACLRPGGLLLLQNRNFDAVLARQDWQMSPQSHREGQTEWLFARFYDLRPDGALTFHVLILRREGADPWRQQIISTRLWPMRQNELLTALQVTNWTNVTSYGDMNASPFDPEHSGNLLITAQRA
jgi:2-polyprenyl-3-methyl-5-hydroxy-6-metoxy-1,4-benzoquinol methylase